MTSEPTAKDFLGIPMIGDGDRRTSKSHVKQRPASELKDAIVSLFDECPHIVGVKWNQYIPYFNDGDVCEFTVSEVLLADDRAESEDNEIDGGEYEEEDSEGRRWMYDYSYYEWFETGEYRTDWSGKRVPVRDAHSRVRAWADEKTIEKAEKFSYKIGPEFYDALEESFGSYATVHFKRVNGELKVFVEEYEAPY